MQPNLLLTKIKYIQLYLLGKLNLDVANNQERRRKLNVDAAVCPLYLIDLGHEGTYRSLAHLELKQTITFNQRHKKHIRLNGKCVNISLDLFSLESDH